MTTALALVRRKLRRAREAGFRPGDVGVAARMTAWAVAIRLLKHRVSLPRLARLAWPRRTARSRATEDQTRVAALAAHAANVAGGRDRNCLTRSLVTYRFLAKAGASPVLVVGFKRGGAGLDGHAWVVVGSQPVGEPAQPLESFCVVLAFGPGGQRVVLKDEPPGATAGETPERPA